VSQLWTSQTGDDLSIFEKARTPNPPAASIIMMKPRKASSDTSRSFWPVDRDVDRRRLRVSPLSVSFFPLLTSAIEFTAEDEGEFRFSGAPMAIVELSVLAASKGAETGGL
jgi:hypothetical protein